MIHSRQSYEKTFIMTSLVILLCLVCLTGATLALFTGKTDDGTIGIVTISGKVEVDIVNAYSGETLVGEVLKFHTTSDNKALLFEPGAILYTQGFKIKNTGNVPIQFRLSVSEDEKIDMEEFKNGFDVWISTTSEFSPEAQKLTSFRGYIDVDESSEDVYYLFVKMKESAGNEFQGKVYTGIGVTVYAVQGNA